MDAHRPTSELAADVHMALTTKVSAPMVATAVKALDALVARVTDLEAQVEFRTATIAAMCELHEASKATAEAQVSALTAEVERLRDAMEGEPEAVRLLSEKVAALTQERDVLSDKALTMEECWLEDEARAEAAEAALATTRQALDAWEAEGHVFVRLADVRRALAATEEPA